MSNTREWGTLNNVSKINALELKEAKLRKTLVAIERKKDKLRSALMFPCVCGEIHKINECVVDQMHDYVPPHGCSGGDYWVSGELHITCPVKGLYNRCLFAQPFWKHAGEYDWNAEMQFKRMFKHLFKDVRDVFINRNAHNNYFFDRNHQVFGIKVKTL